MSRTRPRVVACVAAGAFVAAATFAPSSASAGFFDQLFGGGAPQPAAPTYYPPTPDPAEPTLRHVPLPHVHHRKVAAEEPAPVRQKTTALMDDKTLRPGDAIMMKDGIHIYRGPQTSRHTARQFVPIEAARDLPRTERTALLAMDLSKHDPLKTSMEPDSLSSGRSAAMTQPISLGFRITDARGVSVRYVGP